VAEGSGPHLANLTRVQLSQLTDCQRQSGKQPTEKTTKQAAESGPNPRAETDLRHWGRGRNCKSPFARTGTVHSCGRPSRRYDTLPLVNDLKVAGLRTEELQNSLDGKTQKLRQRAAGYGDRSRGSTARKVYLVGQAMQSGDLPLNGDMTAA